MSVKDMIFNTINELELNIPLAYGFSDGTEFPKIVYFHVNTNEVRYSNKKSKKHHTFQVNFYDVVPHDLDNSEVLSKIQNALEDTILNTSSWQEVIDVDPDKKDTQFMYYIEVYS